MVEPQRTIHPVISVIFMIAVTMSIAGAIYYYASEPINEKLTERMQFQQDVKISIENYTTNDTYYEELFNYSFQDDGGILILFNISDGGRRTYDGHFEVRSFKESNMTVTHGDGTTDEIYLQSGIDIEKVIIWSGTTNELHSYLFSNLIYNDTCEVIVKFICEYGIIEFEPLYNVTR